MPVVGFFATDVWGMLCIMKMGLSMLDLVWSGMPYQAILVLVCASKFALIYKIIASCYNG